MKKQLSQITDQNRNAIVVANLKGGEQIIRIDYPRKFEWWLILPYDYDTDDNTCLLIGKEKATKLYRSSAKFRGQSAATRQYANRITEIVDSWGGLKAELKRYASIHREMAFEDKRFNRHGSALKNNKAALDMELLAEALNH